MQKWNRSTKQRWHPFVGLLSLLALTYMLVACGDAGGTTTQANSDRQNPASAADIKTGSQPCPIAIAATQYWDTIIPTQPPNNSVESVVCANLIGQPTLQALVMVRSAGSGRALDLHVYNNITAPKPNELFRLLNLQNGNAKISGYNTITTAEVDPNSSANKYGNQTPDLFREFKWSATTQTFDPIAFPALFPDLTRDEAENDQQNPSSWELDAAQVAVHFANQYLKWSLDAAATINSGGHNGDASAIVSVTSTGAGSSTIKVTLNRLENNTTNGIWMVTDVTSTPALSITSPINLDIIHSPITVTGQGNASTAAILDHLGNPLNEAQTTGGGNAPFNATITFTPSFTNGEEEGVVVVYNKDVDGTIIGIAARKVLLYLIPTQ